VQFGGFERLIFGLKLDVEDGLALVFLILSEQDGRTGESQQNEGAG
jgi:hypothetical protein